MTNSIKDYKVTDLTFAKLSKDNLKEVALKINVPYKELKNKLDKGTANYQGVEISYGSYIIIEDTGCIFVREEMVDFIEEIFKSKEGVK